MAAYGSPPSSSGSGRRHNGGSRWQSGSYKQPATSVDELLAAVGMQLTSDIRSMKYTSTKDDRKCPLYCGLGVNRESFLKWHGTRYLPLVWEPMEEAARDKREKVLRASRLQFLLQRRPRYADEGRPGHSAAQQQPARGATTRARAAAQADQGQPSAQGEMADDLPPDTDEWTDSGAEYSGATDARQEDIPPHILAAMEDVADMELLSDNDNFNTLIKYVDDSAPMKHSILSRIAEDRQTFATGRQKLMAFIHEMEKAASPEVMQRSMWQYMQRHGLSEQPGEYAVRFREAARFCGRDKATINTKFLMTVLEPWSTTAELAEYVHIVKSEFRAAILDGDNLHVDRMAGVVFEYEAMVISEASVRWEQRGNTPRPTTAPQERRSGSSGDSHAAKLDLPFQWVNGKQYRACAACHVMRGEINWHSRSHCPMEQMMSGTGHGVGALNRTSQQPARQSPGRGQAEQPMQALVGQARSKMLCHQCGQTGHMRSDCQVPQQTEQGKGAQRQWLAGLEKRSTQSARSPDKGKAMYVDSESEDRDVGDAQRIKELEQRLAQYDIMFQQHGDVAGSSGSGSKAFMSTNVHPDWTTHTKSAYEPEGGFNFTDDYSSDEEFVERSAAGRSAPRVLLGTRSLKPGFVPRGLVPEKMVSAATGRPQGRVPRAAAGAGPVLPAGASRQPASARRQERMREDGHDEDRAVRNRLPTGMVNPVDLPSSIAPAVEAFAEGAGDDLIGNEMRVAQLVSLLRNSLMTTKFNALPTEIVADCSAEGAAAWQRAQSDALAGRLHNGQDPRSIAWHTAISRAVNLWAAQAQLTWRDYAQLDLRRIFREAVTATYGPASVVHAATGRSLAMDTPDDMVVAAQVAATVASSESTLAEYRRLRAAWQQSVVWTDRRPVAMVDGSEIPLTINGFPVRVMVLDSGADIDMLHQRVVDRMHVPVNPKGFPITGITGQAHVMPRTVDAVEIALHQGSECETVTRDHMIIMDGESLPDCLVGNETMARLGITVDQVTWTASYLCRPWDHDSPRVQVPLVCPTQDQCAALAALQPTEWPLSWVDFGGEAMEADAPSHVGYGVVCVAARATKHVEIDELPETDMDLLLDAAEKGIGRGDPAPDVFPSPPQQALAHEELDSSSVWGGVFPPSCYSAYGPSSQVDSALSLLGAATYDVAEEMFLAACAAAAATLRQSAEAQELALYTARRSRGSGVKALCEDYILGV